MNDYFSTEQSGVAAIFISTTILALLVAAVLTSRRNKATSLKIPGNPGGQFPIIGDTHRLLNPRTMASYQVDSRHEWSCPLWRTSVLFQQCVFVSGASNLKRLTEEERVKKNTEACFPPHHRALFGEHSVVVVSGSEHLKLRKAISPVLQPHLYKVEIERAVLAFVDGCRRNSKSNENGEYFPLVPELKKFTLRVILRIIVGEDQWQEWIENSTLEGLLEDFSIWSRGLLSPPTSFIPFTAAHKATMARGRISKVLLKVIQEEKEHLSTMQSSNPGKARSLIQRLLQAATSSSNGNGVEDDITALPDEWIVDNIFTLAFAGTDTTASILTSAFLVLSQDVQLRERLQTSIKNESTEKDKPVGLDEEDNDDIKHYFEELIIAFLSEIQRCYPSAPFFMRRIVPTNNKTETSQKSKIEGVDMGNEYGVIPPGFLVTYSIAGTLLDDGETYPNPSEFNVNRWLKKGASRQQLPPNWAFGGGIRMCLGRFLANAESVALLRCVLSPETGFCWELKQEQNFEFSYSPGYFPKDGLLIRVSS